MKCWPPALGRISRRSPPSRGAWIEMKEKNPTRYCWASPPSRGAWIEIMASMWIRTAASVAPLAGGVD